MPRRRSAGSGTIYKNANETYTAQIRTPAGRKSQTFSAERKATSWLAKMRRDMDTGDFVEPSEMSLGVWWDKWIAVYKKPNVSEASLASYAYSRARLPKSLLNTEIGKLTPADIQGALNGIQGRRRTVEITRTALDMCLARAVKDKMIRFNPAEDTELPSDTGTNRAQALSPEADDALIAKLTAPMPNKDRHIRDALYFCRMTGVRRSEAVNLTWEDIKANQVHIQGTKTEESDRWLPLIPAVRDVLDRRRFGSTNKYVFVTRTGKRLDPSSLTRWMSANTDYTCHDLRHTYCTRAAQAGVNPKVLMTLTGHVRVETLLDIYTHVSDQDKASAAAQIFAGGKCLANADEKQAASSK